MILHVISVLFHKSPQSRQGHVIIALLLISVSILYAILCLDRETHDVQEMSQILYRVDRYYAIWWFIVQSTLEMDTGFIFKINFSPINSFTHLSSGGNLCDFNRSFSVIYCKWMLNLNNEWSAFNSKSCP